MDREISKDLFEVENPVYQEYDDIIKRYIGNGVVITNMEQSERGSGNPCKGGIVRYYTKTSKEIYRKWVECGNFPEYGDVKYMGLIPNPGSLGGLFI